MGLKKRHGPPPPIVSSVGSDRLPKALGPYSPGKLICYKKGTEWLFSSGQIGINQEGQLVGEDVEA